MINFTQFITTLERLTVTKVVFEFSIISIYLLAFFRLTVTKVVFELLLELFQCCRMILTVTKVVFE